MCIGTPTFYQFAMKFVLVLVFAAILAVGQGKSSFEEDFIEELYNGECFCCEETLTDSLL